MTGKYYNTIIAETFGNVRHIPVVSFKRYIKTYFLKKYSYLCHVENTYICQICSYNDVSNSISDASINYSFCLKLGNVTTIVLTITHYCWLCIGD